MTHSKEDAGRISELSSAFLTLNDRGKDSALSILRALSFAQAVMSADARETAGSAVQRQTAGAG